jgi:hypothetical protein
MPRRFDDRWQRFAESIPRLVEGGIATSHQRGAMASTWWSERFVDVLATYGLGARMQRGRRYARSGQVMELDVQPGIIVAMVQGSRARPYVVTVRCNEVPDKAWVALDTQLAGQLGIIAALASGEVPAELVDLFQSVGVSLLPGKWSDISATCTCPDDANPCKHVAASLYVFADQLDSDPWLILQWRGRTRDQVLDLLRISEVDDGPAVAPWWPFGPGPVPESLVGRPEIINAIALDASPAELTASPIDRAEPLDIEVLGNLVSNHLKRAYEALTHA